MRTIAFSIAALLCCSTSLGAEIPVLLDAFSRTALVGMQLAAKGSFAQGRIGQARLDCILSVPASSFYPTIRELLESSFTPEELVSAEEFFRTETGRVYTEQGIAGVYSAVGAAPPVPAPQLSKSDELLVTQFASSSAGQRLIREKPLETREARQKFAASINAAVEPCRHAQ